MSTEDQDLPEIDEPKPDPKRSPASGFKLRPDIPVARYKPAPEVSAPGGLMPEEMFVGGKKDDDSRKVQEIWKARVSVFRLPEDNQAYEQVWQDITDGRAHMAEHRLEWDPTNSAYVALLRWVALEYKLPSDVT